MKAYFSLILCGLCLLSSCGGGSSMQSPPPLMITTASLPNATSQLPYSQTILASGGVAPFTWTVSAGTLPHNLGLGSSATNTVTISGTPDTAAQGVAFTIKVTDSANQTATQSYTVSVLLEPDVLSLAPSSLSFGVQLVGTASDVQTETLTNTGTSVLVINGLAISGTNAADFRQSSGCGSSLAAGANCTISVSFTPSQLGPRSASITITDNTMGSPHSLSVIGMGVNAGPNATLSATSLTFCDQVVGTTSPAQSITLSNYGTATLNITSIAASANFGQTHTCGSTLASGAACTISVTFTPSASGSLNGTVSVTDNAPGSPQTVALSGTGVASTCIPQGGACYGPGPNRCCPAPRGHHSYCSNPTGEGTCTES
jgi:Putative Ig domain/Abnormal spindle-like microcephaly-assoc'd, ASPM-SPD-2-Hydin